MTNDPSRLPIEMNVKFHPNFRRLLTVALCSLLIWGCSQSEKHKSPEKKIRSDIPITPYKPKSQGDDSGLGSLPDVPLAQMEDKKSPNLFSITVESADIRKVLKAFARDSKLGIVIDPDVSGNVSVDLKQVTLEETLYFLLDPLDLDYTREGSVLRVTNRRYKTRIFTLNHLLIKRSSSGKIEISSIETESGGTGTGQITSEVETSFWEDLEKQLATLVGVQIAGEADAAAEGGAPAAEGAAQPSESSGGSSLFGSSTASSPSSASSSEATTPTSILETPKLIVNRSSGMILVRTHPEILKDVAQFLEAVEGSVHRQVRIEAKLAEIVLDDSTQYGVNWERFTPFGEKNQNGSTSAKSDPTFGEAPFFTATLRGDRGRATAILKALQEKQKVTILSSPSVSTLNNQPAIIKIAREQPFFKITDKTEIISGVKVTERTVEEDNITIGISLRVTPQISADGDIMMDIHPVITDTIGEDAVVLDPEFGTILASKPVLSVREINTMIRAHDSETVLIAGLIKDRVSQSESRVPLLSDIPILGELFKSKKTKNEKTELVIFITPTIITGRMIHQLSERERRYFKQYNQKLFKEL